MRVAARSLTKTKMTQEHLASLLGVTPRTVRGWLTDRRFISARTIPEPARRLMILIDRVPAVLPVLLLIALEKVDYAQDD